MQPPLGAASVESAHPPFSKTRSIPANYEPSSTKFAGICILARCPRIGKKILENVTPSWGPPPLSWNTVKYLISLAITNKFRWNFQKLVYWLGEAKWVKKCWNMLPPPGAAPAAQPPNYKMRDISANYEPIYTKFSGFIPLTRRKRIIEKMLRYLTPLRGHQQPQILQNPRYLRHIWININEICRN